MFSSQPKRETRHLVSACYTASTETKRQVNDDASSLNCFRGASSVPNTWTRTCRCGSGVTFIDTTYDAIDETLMVMPERKR